MKRVALSMHRKLYWLPMLGMFLLMLVAAAVNGGSHRGSESNSALAVCLVVLIAWAILGRRIAFWLVPLFVSCIKCPGCDEELSPVSVWNCNCGFHDHRERNVLTKRCPKCGSICSHVDCPRCSATILIW